MKFEQLWNSIRRELKNVTDSEEQLKVEGKWIVERATGQKLQYWQLQPEFEMNYFHEKAIMGFLQKRVVDRLPIQYVVGEAFFYGLELKVTPDVLIPRPETELLVEKTLDWLSQNEIDKPLVLDLATGSGCIGLAIKKHVPQANVTATDVSRKALSVAKENARLLSLSIHYQNSNWFKSIRKGVQFDVITCNPPYIPRDEKKELEPEVLAEPEVALFVPREVLPTVLYLDIILNSYHFLKEQGMLIMELGDTVAKDIGEALEKQSQELPYTCWKIESDLSGLPRVLSLFKGHKPANFN